jgi:hypothetical protein
MVRAGIFGKKWLPVRYTVDGRRIERCVLKMLMNHTTVQRAFLNGWEPPAWLPEVIFGRRGLAPTCGLGAMARIGDVVENIEEVGFVFGQSERTGQFGCVLLDILGSLRLVCSWDTPLQDLGELHFQDAVYSAKEDILHHLKRFNMVDGHRDLGLSLDFDWTGRWTARRYPNVAALRGKYGPPPR